MDKIRMNVAGIEFQVDDVEQAKKLMELTLVTETDASPEWTKKFIQAAYQVFVNLNPDTQRINKLRVACGYVENSTETTVWLYQDDATKTWAVTDNANKRAYGESLRQAIDNLEIKPDD